MKKHIGPLLPSFVIFFALLGFIGFFSNIDMSTLEDFIWLKPALDMAQGQVLFKDIFSIYGMFVAFLYAMSVKLLGPYLLLLRIETVFAYGLTGVLLFHIWSQYISKKLAMISLLLWLILAPFYTHMLLPWNSVYALVFQNITFLLLIIFIKKQYTYLIFFTGAGIGLTFFTRQPVGIFLLGSTSFFFLLMFFLKKYSFQKLSLIYGYLFAGIFTSSIPFISYLLFHGIVYDWWVQSFVYARELAAVVRGVSIDQIIKSLTIARYLKNGTYHLNSIWILIPLSIFYLFIPPIQQFVAKKKLSDENTKLILAALICLASWMQYYPATDPIHFFWAISPTIGFFVYVIVKMFLPKKKGVLMLFTFLFGIEMILLLTLRVVSSIPRIHASSSYSQYIPSLRNIKLTSYDRDKIDSFQQKLVSHLEPNDTFVNISDDAMVPLLDKRFHFIPPLYMEWGFATDKFYKKHSTQILSYISSHKPLIVTRTLPFIPDYCSIKDVQYQQEEMGIHINADKVMRLVVEDTVLRIEFKKDMNLIGIDKLLIPIVGFSVPDKKKLLYTPFYQNVSYPLIMEKNTTLIVPFPEETKKPYWLIFRFDNTDIVTCTYAINK